MDTSINPQTLKELRKRRKLTQDTLADISGISIATIKRIESGAQNKNGNRYKVIKDLAKALEVDPDSLLSPDEPAKTDDDHLRAKVIVKETISRSTELSFQTVEAIYGISRSAQITMAPLFAAMIAEASLEWRRQRLKKLSDAANVLDDIRSDNPLLNGAFFRAWESEKIEAWSIDERDVLGHRAFERLKNLQDAQSEFDADPAKDAFPFLPEEWASPLLTFLEQQLASIAQSPIEIERLNPEERPMADGTVDYRIGATVLDQIWGSSIWARMAVEYGYANINQIPERLRGRGKDAERQAYLSSLVPITAKREFAKNWLEEINALWPERACEVSEDNISRAVEQFDKEGEGQ